IPFGESTRQTDAGHCGLSSTVAHPYLLDGRHQFDDKFSHLDLERIWRSKACAALESLLESLADWSGIVSVNRGSPSTDKIDQLAAIGSVQVRTVGLFDEKWGAAYGAECAD